MRPAWVTGVSERLGGPGDLLRSPRSACSRGIEARREALGTSSLDGVRVVVQGAGKVGYHLVRHLRDAGAVVTVADVDVDAVARAVNEFGVETVEPDKAHAVECEIFAPCALGAVDPRRHASQPEVQGRRRRGEQPARAARARRRPSPSCGILYAPDYVINAGGLMNVADELMGYDRERAMAKVEGIYRTLREVFLRSRMEGITPVQAADRLAEDRIREVSRVRLLWVPGPGAPTPPA